MNNSYIIPVDRQRRLFCNDSNADVRARIYIERSDSDSQGEGDEEVPRGMPSAEYSKQVLPPTSYLQHIVDLYHVNAANDRHGPHHAISHACGHGTIYCTMCNLGLASGESTNQTISPHRPLDPSSCSAHADENVNDRFALVDHGSSMANTQHFDVAIPARLIDSAVSRPFATQC